MNSLFNSCGNNDMCGGNSWIIILIIIFVLCGGFGTGTCGNGCGNGCGCNNGCC